MPNQKLGSTAEDAGWTYTTAAKRSALPSALPQRPRLDGATVPKPGQIARCRHRNWLVQAVYPPREERRNAAHLVDLVCLDDDAPGRELSVLWELELGAHLTEPESGQLRGLEGFDPPDRFAAYLNTLRWNATTAADASLFQAPLRAGIHVQPFQLAPLMKALELPRANLFIADDVGLGKTVEAGLVLQELLLRQRVEFVLVVAPASVCLQWKEELYKRFGLHFQIYDRAFVAHTRQQRGYRANPWTTHNRFIISYPLLRRAEYLEPLRAFLGEHREHGKRRKSLLILDEAHTVAPASGSSYAVDSAITRIAREHLCPRFENRLFLSATPHNGHSNSFSALLELLDPQRFHRAAPATASALEAVMIRRLKRDIRRVAKGLFPRREVVALTLHRAADRWSVAGSLHAPRPEVPGYERPALPLERPWALPRAATAPELELAAMLRDYEEAVAPANKGQRLVFANLQKRLFSSIPAFYRTLSAHAASFDKHFAGRLDKSYIAPEPPAADTDADAGASADTETDSEFDRADAALDAEELESTAAASATFSKPSERARADLQAMLDLAGRHRGTPDARVLALLEWIRQNQCPGIDDAATDKRWGPRKLLIFTEYTDTKSWLRRLLQRAFAGTERGDERILEIHGALSDEKREEIQRAFNAPPADHPVRVLLATDAAREGINLQGACADLIHFDIPWNPARLEQRNGRIDRTLQPEPEARCHYFVYADRKEDAVLDTIVRKVDVIRDELGSVGSVVMGRIAELLEGQTIRASTRDDVEAAATPGARQQVVQLELDQAMSLADKRLDADIRRAGTRYSDAAKHLNFEPRLLRHALDVALALLGAPPLKPVAGEGGVHAFEVPELPPGWESTLDALRRPRARDESLWEWRRAAPPQPVVFDPPPQMTSPRVHLHLHHPLVRRLLDVFTSAGFGAHQLQHLSLLKHDFDGHVYAVALARVSLFGNGAVRLHDELVTKIVRVGGDTADGPLESIRQLDEGKLHGIFEGQLSEEEHAPPPAARAMRPLLARAPGDFAELWPLLRGLGEHAAEAAGRRLSDRGAQESEALKKLLAAQREQLREQLPLKDVVNDLERRQREADLAARADRLAAIDRELQEEPADLRAMYEIKLSRIEPVGLVYLWPKVWG
ncbi:MAG: DEAD/DEAH box helicase family protein [Myxococcales bacterium]|nr:DEAD/DEAH box helicase family protein [Myxococcales bacterium]